MRKEPSLYTSRLTIGRLLRRLPVPSFSRDVWLVSVTMAMLGGAYLGMMQLVKVLYLLRLGQGPEFLGILFATGALGFAACSLLAGALGGRFGPRRVMIVGGIICAAGMGILPLAESVPRSLLRFWVLLVQVVSSGGWSLVVVNQVAALMTFTTAENRQRAYAMKEAFLGLGTFLGALIGGLLPGVFAGLLHLTTDQPAPYRHTLWVAAAVAAATLVPLVLTSEVRPSAPALRGQAFRPPLLPFAMLVGCGFFNNAAVASQKAFVSAYMDTVLRLPTSSIGVIMSMGQFLAIVGALSSARLARLRGSGHAMMIASSGLALSLLLLATVRHPVATAVGTIGALSLAAVWVPAYQVLQMEMAAPEWRSRMAGAASMGLSLGFGTLSFTGGYIVAGLGYPWVFLAGALSAGLSAAVIGSLPRRTARERPAECSGPMAW